MRVEEGILKLFSQVKLRNNLKGYDYLYYAVLKRYGNESYKGQIYTKLYKEVAEQFHTSVECVERNIRNLIDSTWTNEYAEAQYELYADIIPPGKDKPQATRFIEHSIVLVQKMVTQEEMKEVIG